MRKAKIYSQCHAVCLLTALALMAFTHAKAGIADTLSYKFGRLYSFSNHQTPLWLTSNTYGMSSYRKNHGHLRLGLDATKMLGDDNPWKLQYGADVALTNHYASTFLAQQLYASVEHKKWQLTLGSREHASALHNDALSSGAMGFGINARPVPELCIETSDYLNLLKNSPVLGLRFRFGYGRTTDEGWQSDYTAANMRRTSNTWLHRKAGYLRVGHKDVFPLVAEAGLEWATTFGGTTYNRLFQGDNIKFPSGIKQFVESIYGGGTDSVDPYANAGGNTLGAAVLKLTYHLPNEARVSFTYDHFFEDHSQMFFEYGMWKDALYGLEINVPHFKPIHTVLYEYNYTKDQSGAVYHDSNATIPDQISARDDYYNHMSYTGWQHWGMSMGNAFFVSPIAMGSQCITFPNTRFEAHHIGIAGTPLRGLDYRLLCSYTTNHGTYLDPLPFIMHSTSGMAEVAYTPACVWRLGNGMRHTTYKIAVGFDHGRLLGNNFGVQFSYVTYGLFSF